MYKYLVVVILGLLLICSVVLSDTVPFPIGTVVWNVIYPTATLYIDAGAVYAGWIGTFHLHAGNKWYGVASYLDENGRTMLSLRISKSIKSNETMCRAIVFRSVPPYDRYDTYFSINWITPVK